MERKKSSLQFLGSLVAALLFGLLFAQGLYAQVDTGAILGTVKDQSGAVVPGAKVILTNEGTNSAFSKDSQTDGTYNFTPVKIGVYTVSAEAQGFSKAVQSHLTLNINQDLVVDLTLKPGAVTQTIEVTARAPALQTENASVGQVVNSAAVNNLPLNGRNWTFLAQTVAGVNTPQADTRGNAASGAFSANGLRPAQNNYLLDGIDNNEDTVDFLNGTNYVVLPPVDAVQEFKVQTSDYSAQYGRSGAAILNATIKSGTNNFHGDVFEFLRNDRLDAADFFEDAGGVKKGEFRLNQFGGTIGGPIIKNKLFFFGDFEALRRRQGGVVNPSVPTALERSSGFTNLTDIINGQNGTHGDLLGRTFPVGTVFDPATTRRVTGGAVDPATGLTAASSGFVRDPFSTCALSTTNYTGANIAACNLNILPAGRLDPNAINILKNLYPAPNGPGIINNFTASPVTRENRNAFDTRIDFNQSDKNLLFGRFSYVDDPQFIAGTFGGIADGGAFQQGDQKAISIQGALSLTHTFSSTTINEARIGENRIHTSRFGPVAKQFGIPAQFGISSSIPQCCENGGLPAFGINGLNTLGSNAFLPSDEVSQTTQVADNLTKIYGKHSFKGGIEYQRVKFSTLQPPWSHGQFNYDGIYTRIPNGQSDSTGMAQLLLTPTTCNKILYPGCVDFVGGTSGMFSSNISLTDDGKNYFGGYFEDDWKMSSKLTLNLGVRWDYFGQTFEHFGAQANFIPGTRNGTAAYLIPSNRKKDTLSSDPALCGTNCFTTLLAQDGIALKYIGNRGVGESQKGNFSPRVGFAYQVTPKLVARGGFGIFYGGFENRGFSPNLGESYPFQFNFSFFSPNDTTPISQTSFSNFAGTPCANFFPFESGFDCTPLQTSLVKANGLSLRGIQFNYLTPYTEGYNLTFQYALSENTTVSMGYVGNVARHLEVFPSLNQVSQILPPGIDTHATSSPGVGLYIPFPDFQQGSSYATTEGNSIYHSLQTSFEKRFSAGLNLLGTYTYARCRSDAGDLLNGGAVGYRAPYVPGFGIQGDYSDCNFDIRHVFHFSGGWELPIGKGKRFLSSSSGAVNQILGDWSTQWITTLETGQPRTIGCAQGTTSGTGCNAFIVKGVNRHGSGSPDHFYNAAAFSQPCAPGGTSPGPAPNGFPGCIPGLTGLALLGGTDGQVSGPGLKTFDFSVFKNFQVTEHYRLEFRSEFFNILNHPTFNAPGFGGNGVLAITGAAGITSNNFGKISSTRFPFNDPREIQMALKLYF